MHNRGNDSLRLGVVHRIIFAVYFDEHSVHRPVAAGHIHNAPAGNKPDQCAQNIDSHSACHRGLKPFLFQKTGADYHIGLPAGNRFQQLFQIGYIVLPIPIHLYGNIIIIFSGIDISRLHRSANPHIDRKIQIVKVLPPAQITRIVGRAVVDYQIIVLRRRVHHMLYHMHNIFRFIVCRYDNQHPLTLFHAFLHFLALSRI